MTGQEVETYIREDLESIPRHNCDALAEAINYVALKLEEKRDGRYTTELELMELLLANKPISYMNTHSYGFHTSVGRELIEGMKNYYYEENN